MIGEECRLVFGNGKKISKLQVCNPYTLHEIIVGLPLLLVRLPAISFV